MRTVRIFGIVSLVSSLLLVPWGGSGAAEKKFPFKPLQVIIPFQPGDTDNLLRPYEEKAPGYLGQPVSMVYKPGAAGAVGAGFVASSKADGYTLVGSSQSSIVVVPLTQKEVGYTWESFAPVSCLVETASMLVVQSSAPWKDLKELVEDSRKSPEKITYSSSGTFGTNHLIPEALCKEAGIKWTFIPSQGSGP
jgi:tripartite-type tricarboxylate transporter receptor subunit TctC